MTRIPSPAASLIGAALLVASVAAAHGQAPAPNPSFNLVNKSPQAVKELFATPAGFDNWGKSRLEGKPIAPGATFAVRLPANGNCRYDIRIVTADGRKDDRRGIDTCNTDDVIFSGATGPAPVAATAPGSTASIKLINTGASPVSEFYARRPGAADWGANRLVTGGIKAAVAPNAALALAIPLDGACAYDLRVVFDNHQSREKKNADLCRITELPVK